MVGYSKNMPVYVDNSRNKYGRMVMCHMLADSSEELNAMAKLIGLNKKWLQHESEYKEHYDISLSKRKLAVDFGAIEIGRNQLVSIIRRRRNDE